MQYNQPYGVSDPQAPYINGNPSTGTMGSIPPAASIEFPQREIVNFITDSSIEAPTNSTLRQLSRAIQSGMVNYGHDTGLTNFYACNLTPPPLSYYDGLTVILKIAHANSGPSVLNVNGLGNKPIIRYDGTPFTGVELKNGMLACFRYDGAQFQHIWPATYTVGGLVYLSAPRDYYVNFATGNDAWDGLQANSAGDGKAGPFKTIQQAAAQVPKFNLNGYNINIHIADSLAYAGQVLCPAINGSGTVFVTGNTAAPQNVLLNNPAGSAFAVTGSTYVFDGLTVGAPNLSGGDPGAGFLVGVGGYAILKNIAFNRCRSSHAEGSGTIWVNGPITINSGAGAFQHMMPSQAGRVILDPLNKPNLSILGPVSFSNAFACSTQLGIWYSNYGTITGYGNVAGPKYSADMNAIIQTLGAGVGFFPGTSAGATATGGQYS